MALQRKTLQTLRGENRLRHDGLQKALTRNRRRYGKQLRFCVRRPGCRCEKKAGRIAAEGVVYA